MKGENAVMKAVGKRIQYYRKARGYTQEQFAEMIDLSTNYLSDVERGKSSPRHFTVWHYLGGSGQIVEYARKREARGLIVVTNLARLEKPDAP